MSALRPARAAFPALAALVAAAPAGAQLIAPKTVPVAQGDQFEIFPSRRVGMGGASIALPDTLRDPFVNPAKATRLGETRIFSAPTFYGISEGGGGGRTIPLGSSARFGAWNGVATVALQQLDKGDAVNFSGTQRFSDRTAINQYAAGSLGRRLPGRAGNAGWSVGLGTEWAGLNAVDGVNLLYQGSDRIDQAGRMLDFRAGLLRDWENGRSLELLVVHNRFAMTHDVSWRTWTWDPARRTSTQGERVDRNEDRTNTWGLHLQHTRPLGTAGWRVGYAATANRLSHPKIPNYSIMNIPRDPGTTYAYNAGVGVARTVGAATFAADVVYEPMWSTTWADAARDTTGPTGIVVPRGQRTVDNDFRFSNALLRLGVGREATLSGTSGVGLGVRAGVAMYSINYRLDQADRVRGARRSQREQWVEWTPTWGVSFRFPELELHYTGRYTTGVGRPGVVGGCCAVPDAALMASAGSGIIVAPSAPLTLQDVRVLAHQVSFSLPIR